MSESIKFSMEFISGDLPLTEAKMHCIAQKKYNEVRLGFSHKGSMIVCFAEIKLYDSGLAIDAMACFEDAQKLGKAIALAWNGSNIKGVLTTNG